MNFDEVIKDILRSYEVNEITLKLSPDEWTVVNAIMWAMQDIFLDYLEQKDIDGIVGDSFINALSKINNA